MLGGTATWANAADGCRVEGLGLGLFVVLGLRVEGLGFRVVCCLGLRV